MSTDDKPQKISIGFHGGQQLAARVKPAELAKLREALGRTGGWHELTAEDGVAVFDLTRVDYLLIDVEQHTVGF
ncbi:MAG: hypothetical protein FWD04_09290 [Conexibacteraceae bacterium]|nr:hypothetical protein [Conexibacteraceae bacterium]